MLNWLAGLADLGTRRRTALILVVGVALADLAFRGRGFSFAPRALTDEPCHLATALILLGAFTRWRGRPPGPAATGAMLAASVLIDVDHLPLEFGSASWTSGTPRPYSHALWVVAVITVIALAARRRYRIRGEAAAVMTAAIATGAVWGVCAHFLRDIATGPVALLWPLSDAGLRVPYPAYLIALLVIAASVPDRLPAAFRSRLAREAPPDRQGFPGV